jgi:hypothetical protein
MNNITLDLFKNIINYGLAKIQRRKNPRLDQRCC